MISRRGGLKELAIFDNFEIDRKLPKYAKDDASGKKSNSNFINFNNTGDSESDEGGVWLTTQTTSGNVSMKQPFGGNSFRNKLVNWLLRKPKVIVPVAKIGVIEFFTNLSKSYTELTPIADIATHYKNALLQANNMGQTALVEKLKNLIDVVRGEAHLIQMNLRKYVTEKQVIDFYELVGEDKNLKLTWIKNFGRIIPDEVYEIKKNVDERNVFDNYVILHYDPENNGEALTKAEIEKKKDPILFGVIKNSKKLYYVADWKDDYCELTLEEMFTKLGDKVLKINNKNVKTFIDKV